MPSANRLTLGAVGDVAFRGDVDDCCATHGVAWAFAPMQEHLARADLLFGNSESVFLPPDFPMQELDETGLVSRLPGPDLAAGLRAAGFDILNMAANHVLDAGALGLDYTRACLQEAGLAAGGVGWSQAEARQPVVLERNGLRLGFLCYGEDSNWTLGHTSPGFAYYELNAVVEDVRKLRPQVDIVVVSLHADLEFMETPSLPRLHNSRAIAKAGADLILQHHPHVPQGIEMVDGCLIAYSLGNFLFNAHSSAYMKSNGPHTADSYLLLVELDASGVQGFERIPCRIPEPPEQRPTPLAGQAAQDFLAYCATLDGYLGNEEFVKARWREIATRHLGYMLRRCGKMSPERFIEEMVGRLFLTAESRSWMQEILAMGQEQWDAAHAEDIPYRRPNCRFMDDWRD